MIKSIIESFEENKAYLRKSLESESYNYSDLVRCVVGHLTNDDNPMDPERVHVIDDGDYQGTLVYVIAEKGYQPSRYWCVRVGYGSCSACDTLQGIYEDEDNPKQQVDDLMTLALHIVQELKEI